MKADMQHAALKTAGCKKNFIDDESQEPRVAPQFGTRVLGAMAAQCLFV
jgi:hypothetical protein